MIKAECWSDDRAVEVSFDATTWFEQASEQKIKDLAGCGWRGDYPADDVAHFMADLGTIANMFTYLEQRAKIEVNGFECSVNEDDAMNWLKINRPSYYDEILQGQEA